MRSIFLKIFLSFWLAMIATGAVTELIHVVSDPGSRTKKFQNLLRSSLYSASLGLINNNGEEQRNASIALMQRIENDIKAHLDLIGADGHVLTPRPPSAEVLKLASELHSQNSPLEKEIEGIDYYAEIIDLQHAPSYAMVINWPHRSFIEHFLRREMLPERLFAILIITGILCYGLAYYFTRPIRILRRSAQSLAAGNLSSRVGPSLKKLNDETADLGRDFDIMAERIEGLINAQRRLIQDISHELRSPLARLGVALGLVRKKAGANLNAPLDRIELETERLNELIGQLLSLTTLETDFTDIPKQEMNLSCLLKQIVQDTDYEAKAQTKGVELTALEEITIFGVSELLHRAFENVMRNAIRFTGANTIVSVELKKTILADHHFARLSVRDHGPGVPESMLDNIFKPFYRVEEARERERGGTGIGLAIAQRAILLHGGSIKAENAVDGGLRVTIEIPIDR